MNTDNDKIDEMLECAVREKGLMEHIESLDSQKRIVWTTLLRRVAYAAAACIVALAGISLKLGSDARNCGNAFDLNDGQRGGSAITALIESGKLKEAREMIEDRQEYVQLEEDIEELEFLDCICLLRQGKYFCSRKGLKRIAEGGGIYANEAKELLEKL